VFGIRESWPHRGEPIHANAFSKRLAVASSKPSVVRPMVSDFNDDDVTLSAVADDRVEQPPERWQVLHVQIIQAVLVPQCPWDAVLLHDFSMETVREKDGTKGANAPRDRRIGRVSAPVETSETLRCGGRKNDVSGSKPHYSRGPLRIASRSSCEASGTQMSPLLPSAIIPWSPKKAIAAFRLCRVVEWPHRARVSRSRLRLMGPSAFRRPARTYSMVAKVGFAPGFANLGSGGFADWAMLLLYVSIYYMYIFIPESRRTPADGNKHHEQKEKPVIATAGVLLVRCVQDDRDRHDRGKPRGREWRRPTVKS